jgi:IS5 family transposase
VFRCQEFIRDIRRKIDGDAVLEARFGPLLGLAQQVRSQDQHQRGPKVYALVPAFESADSIL